MKKKLVFLALALVLVLACAVAVAAPAYQNGNSMHWENTGIKAADLVGKTIKIGDGTTVEVTKVEIHKEPTCTEAAQWKIYHKDLTGNGAPNLFVIGYFDEGYKRAHSGHVWASDFAWDKGIKSVTLDPATGIYTVTYANGTSTELHGSVMIKEPTCTAKGESYDFCVYCGTVNKTKKQEVPKLDHNFAEQAKGDWMDCLHQEKEMHTVFRCKVCGTLQVDDKGKAIEGKLKWEEITDAAKADGAVKGTDGKLYKLVSDKTGNNFVADYVKAGLEVKTGHKWDGWAPGVNAPACKQFRHCMICEQTQDKTLAADWVATGEVKIINCYLAQQAQKCARCNGATPGHEAHIVFIYSGDEAEADADTTPISEGALGVNGAKTIKELHNSISMDDFVCLNKHTYAGETKEAHAYHVKEHSKYIIGGKEEAAPVYELGVAGRNCCVDLYTEVFKCAKCGLDIEVAHGPNGHQLLDWEMVYAPNAGENKEGEWIRKCFKCGWTEKYHGTTAPAANFVQETYDVTNGLQLRNGVWGWYKDDVLQAGVNSLVPYNGAWFVIKDGTLDTSYEGLYTYDGAQFYVSAGQLRDDLNGVVVTLTGAYFFANGQLQSQYTGLALYDGHWFYLVNGIPQLDYNGIVEHDGQQFVVVGGQIQ